MTGQPAHDESVALATKAGGDTYTVGLSPKAAAAGIAATLAPPVAGWLLKQTGLKVEVSLLAAIIGSGLVGLAGLAAAAAAKAGFVVVVDGTPHDPGQAVTPDTPAGE